MEENRKAAGQAATPVKRIGSMIHSPRGVNTSLLARNNQTQTTTEENDETKRALEGCCIVASCVLLSAVVEVYHHGKGLAGPLILYNFFSEIIAAGPESFGAADAAGNGTTMQQQQPILATWCLGDDESRSYGVIHPGEKCPNQNLLVGFAIQRAVSLRSTFINCPPPSSSSSTQGQPSDENGDEEKEKAENQEKESVHLICLETGLAVLEEVPQSFGIWLWLCSYSVAPIESCVLEADTCCRHHAVLNPACTLIVKVSMSRPLINTRNYRLSEGNDYQVPVDAGRNCATSNQRLVKVSRLPAYTLKGRHFHGREGHAQLLNAGPEIVMDCLAGVTELLAKPKRQLSSNVENMKIWVEEDEKLSLSDRNSIDQNNTTLHGPRMMAAEKKEKMPADDGWSSFIDPRKEEEEEKMQTSEMNPERAVAAATVQ
ncbi:hypothetical protein DAPPUDRAFT_233069 [Daphnia pulex]|uniref:Uncharacterized protein n=1 Tax=Daphnia pulex TaxID=6669 RepID=E9FT38_DAPPU|nr:hypothetical protein DAPPUDRAFT_233069 [Daphnia pulex]|eukprot:EFX89304.1 hypothetical protein DAPPUDRAFT_233069 [Daphnia pulex]